MIPKIIHYCWFGGNPLPPFACKCIESWKKFLPDYEIKEWNEENFDVNSVPYVREAYNEKKYAFVSDYVRFFVLYKFGGLYFDTDVEIINNVNDVITKGPFMGCENYPPKDCYPQVNPGLGLGAEPEMLLYKNILDMYRKMHFLDANGQQIPGTVVTFTTELLVEKGLKKEGAVQNVGGVWIYPKDYFCPMDYITGNIDITKNSRTIHHYSATWLPWYGKFEKWICHKLGLRYRDFLHRNVPKIKNIFGGKK